jgi:hypothetical protein
MQPLPPGVQEQLNKRCACMSKPIEECDCQFDQIEIQEQSLDCPHYLQPHSDIDEWEV